MNRRRFIAGAIGGAGLLGLGGYARFGEPGWLQVTAPHLDRSDDGASAPSLRIAQISDLHLRELRPLYGRTVSALAERRPDLIVITGDSIDGPAGLPLLDELLGGLPGMVPAFAILGNWEHWGGVDIEALRRVYDRRGVRLLVNESATMAVAGRSVVITGLDDVVGGRPDLRPALRPVQPGELHLLLAHCPVQRDLLPPGRDAGTAGISAILSGHTHGGQVNVLGWAPFTPRGSGGYVQGWYAGDDRPPMYVCRGIGTSVAPVRIGARPELAFVELRG